MCEAREDVGFYRPRQPQETPFYKLACPLKPWRRGVAEEVCAEVAHRQFVFTIPKRLRIYFRYDRSLLGELCQAACRRLCAVYRRREAPGTWGQAGPQTMGRVDQASLRDRSLELPQVRRADEDLSIRRLGEGGSSPSSREGRQPWWKRLSATVAYGTRNPIEDRRRFMGVRQAETVGRRSESGCPQQHRQNGADNSERSPLSSKGGDSRPNPLLEASPGDPR